MTRKRVAASIAALLFVVALGALAFGIATCQRLPIWSGEVEVTAIDNPDVDACGRGELTEAGEGLIHRPPYLQMVSTSGASVLFAAWPDPAFAVELSTPEGEVVDTEAAHFDGPDPRRSALLERRDELDGDEPPAADYFIQRVDLDGLEADTLYCYRLLGPGGAHTELAPLRTAPAASSDASATMIVVGDSGSGSAAQKAIAARFAAIDFDLMLFLGDVAYTDGTAAELERNFFAIYGAILRVAPAYPILGNHEYRTANGAPYLASFALPDRERYYSFDWGDVHIVALDTNRITARQADWVAADLAANQDATWTIVMGHHPPFSSSWRGPNRRYQRMLLPLFEEHGVDLVLSGHEHHYERMQPRRGIHYVVTGGGGGRLTKVGRGPRTEVAAAVHHFVVLRVSEGELELRAIDIDGEVVDTLVLEPSSP